MGEVIGVISLTLQLVEQVCETIARLRRANAQQQTLGEVLRRHHNELRSLKAIIKIIEKHKDLQTSSVDAELHQLEDIQKRLTKLLATLEPKQKSRANQLIHQLVQGSADEKKLSTIMDELVHIKATLLLHIQDTNVGVTRTMGEQLVANAQVIQRVDATLRKYVGDREGLPIAQLIKGRDPRSDGLVPLTEDDIKALKIGENDGLSVSDGDDSLGETLVDHFESSGRNTPIKNERIVTRNTSDDQSIQFNSIIDTDVCKHISRLVIKDNHSKGQSIQFNHGQSLEVALAFYERQRANTWNNNRKDEVKRHSVSVHP